jgi:hypothetical protein
MGEMLVRCFDDECSNFKKGKWVHGGECSMNEIVISSGEAHCLTREPTSSKTPEE